MRNSQQVFSALFSFFFISFHSTDSGAEGFNRLGVFVELALGAGGDTDNLKSPTSVGTFHNNTGAGFALGGAVKYRVLPFFSFGADFRYTFMPAEVTWLNQKKSDTGGLLTTGLVFEGYPPLNGRIDPFIGFGVHYAMWRTKGGADVTYLGQTYRVEPAFTLHGLALSFSGGVRIFVIESLSVGPVFSYYYPFWFGFCVSGEYINDSCEDVSDISDASKDFKNSLPHLWFAGVLTSYSF